MDSQRTTEALPSRINVTRLKRWVVLTSFFPLRPVYIALYKLIAWWVARHLCKDPDVGAVYLRAGGTRGEVLPGISDIDLMVILSDEVELSPGTFLRGGGLRPFGRRYQALLPWLPLLDKRVIVFPAARLAELAQTSLERRYSLMEMRRNNRLLKGRDYIAERVPELPEPIGQDALLACIETRWHWYLKHLVHKAAWPRDDLALKSMCYRYICDALRYMADFRTGEVTLKRAGVLSRELEFLSGEDRTFAQDLIGLRQRRFLSGQDNVVESTQRFLLRQYDRFYGQLADHPFARPLKQVHHQVDYQASEDFVPAAEWAMVRQLMTHVEEQWQEQLLGAYLVQSVFFGVDEQQLLLQVDSNHLPTNVQLVAFYALYEQLQAQVPRKVRPYLLLPNVACCLATKGLFKQNLHSMLPQALIVDLFVQVQQTESQLRPALYKVWNKPVFTAQAGCFFWSQRLRQRQLIESWNIAGDPRLEMVRQWWKWLQLEVVHRGIERGSICYPLTLSAIGRGLPAVGLDPPACMEEMAVAYQRGVDGEEVAVEAAIEQALSYVQKVDPQGHRFDGPPSWLQDG